MGETAQEVGKSSILSAEERRGIVRSFVNAYLRGSVKITLWLQENPRWLSTHQAVSGDQIASLKKGVLSYISIVSGSTPSSPEVIDHAINSLFSTIVSLRGGDFIQGEFLHSPELETRLSALEVKVDSMEQLLEELQHIWKIRGPQP
jgi:hypothetical protein